MRSLSPRLLSEAPLARRIDGSGIIARPNANANSVAATATTTERTTQWPAFDACARGYVVKDAVESELVTGVDEVASGRIYVNPALGARIAGERTADHADRQLTTREQEIVSLVARGLSNREIAEKLWLCPRTVENQRLRAMRRICVTSRSELVAYAIEAGLV